MSDEVSQLECFDKGLISTDAGFPFLVGKPIFDGKNSPS